MGENQLVPVFFQAQFSWLRLLIVMGSVVWGSGMIAASVQAAPVSNSSGQRPQQIAQAQAAPITQMLFVNPVLGDDVAGEGTLRSPVRTITRALQLAEPNTTLILAGGQYSRRSGEQFPLRIPVGITLVEDPAAASPVVIVGEVIEGVAMAEVSTPAPTPAAATRPAPTPAPTPVTATLPAPNPAPMVATDPIIIPVPPIAAAPAPPPTPAPPTFAAPAIATPQPDAPIIIPVPPPEQATTPAPIPVSVAPPAPVAAPRNPDLLPVPDPNAPIGYVGDLPTVRLAATVQSTGGSGGLQAPVAAVPEGLRYRVLVRPANDATREWVYQLVPDAFETTTNGQSVLQIGAFRELGRAEAAAEQLSQNGVRAFIEQW